MSDVGLTDKEASVYLSALSLGPSAVAKIAQAAEIKRTTVYSVIESLKRKGLMREELDGWKMLYAAETPDKLEGMIDRMRGEIHRAMPELDALHSLKTAGSFIRYYEGLESVRGVYEDLLKDIRPREDYMVIGNQRKWLDQDQKYFSAFIEKRKKLNINIRILMQESEVAREHKRLERNFNEKIKIMPPKFNLTTNLVIIPRRVVINQLTPPISAMAIENPSIIQMHRELFEMIWKSLPE